LEVRPTPSLMPDALSFHVSVSRARRGRISPGDGNTRAECARSRLAWRDRRRYHRGQPACARSFDGNSHSLRWPPSLGMLPAMWPSQSRPVHRSWPPAAVASGFAITRNRTEAKDAYTPWGRSQSASIQKLMGTISPISRQACIGAPMIASLNAISIWTMCGQRQCCDG
jgi:hypothetical protein